MSTNTWEAWNDGAEGPMGVYPTRQLARTKILAEAGFMCQGGKQWLYGTSMFTGSASLPDTIRLVHKDDESRKVSFTVRKVVGR